MPLRRQAGLSWRAPLQGRPPQSLPTRRRTIAALRLATCQCLT